MIVLEDIQATNKHLKQCSKSLEIQRLQIQTKMKHHCIATRLPIFFGLNKHF